MRALIAGAHDVVADQDCFHARPFDGAAELLHELDAAVLFQAVCQGEVGQGEVDEIQAAGSLFEFHANLVSFYIIKTA